MQRRFREVDVFTETPFGGNPVAVVLDSDGLTTGEMQRFANWTNLSETTFVSPPSSAEADYRVRIFTPSRELPFAGHPTLGTCHAWLEAGGKPSLPEVFVQECGAGLVGIRQVPAGLAFAAPPLIRSGPVEEPVAEHIAALLGISRASITDLAWADNGPGWAAVLLPSPEAVLALRPGALDMEIGVAACYPAGSPEAIEVRAFFRSGDATIEDPVTGSLNASLAQWLLDTGRVSVPYVARQGTALGRSGRVHIFREADGQIWVGGGALTCVSGYAEL
ncbi:MAG: phenazine biosynthesis protein PhzF [Actinomycetia bacterium]|nr:phenazine biosynthesis protein PhzF [Actinomycetes bacterium]